MLPAHQCFGTQHLSGFQIDLGLVEHREFIARKCRDLCKSFLRDVNGHDALVEIIDVLQSIRAPRDPKDDKFLEAAVNGRADVIVTGDKDLRDLNPFRGIAIVTPAAYLARET